MGTAVYSICEQQRRSLISAFVVRCLVGIIPVVSTLGKSSNRSHRICKMLAKIRKVLEINLASVFGKIY